MDYSFGCTIGAILLFLMKIALYLLQIYLENITGKQISECVTITKWPDSIESNIQLPFVSLYLNSDGMMSERNCV